MARGSIISRLPDHVQRQIRAQLMPKPKAAEARQPVCFTMPIPPSVNHLFSNAGRKRVKSSAYQAWWDATLKELTMIQHIPHVSGKVALFFEIRRFSDLSDLSNRIKSAEDAIVAARIIEDDRYVLELHAKWSKEIATCNVRIEPR